MASYRPLDEITLAGLTDPELIEHVVEARAAGDDGQADFALRIFAFGLEGPVRAYVRNRMGSHPDPVIDEVAERALEDAIKAITTLRGRTAEEGRAFVFRIARLRIADYFRKGRLDTDSIDDEGRRAPMDHQAALAVEDEADAIDTAIVLDQALDCLRPDHRATVELFLISGYSARETAAEVSRRFDDGGNDSMSEQNVNQIVSRFRKELRTRLQEDRKV